MKCGADIRDPQRMNPDDFGDPHQEVEVFI